MCGIAGIIYRNGNGGRAVGHDMTAMLQSMKHRGPDSTGYALYGPASELVVMRYKLADANDRRDLDFAQRLEGFVGTHAIGHVRMATESDVDISGAHPYWAYPFGDVAVVHNGQLTNYFQWKHRLERSGHRFQSECEVMVWTR